MFSYPTVHTQQSTVPPGVAEHNVTVARAFTKLIGAFVTFWNNDAGSKILLANPGRTGPHCAARQKDSLLESQMQLGSLQHPSIRESQSTSTFLGPCTSSRSAGCPPWWSAAVVRVAALVHRAGRPRVVHLVEALHGLVLVVLAAFSRSCATMVRP